MSRTRFRSATRLCLDWLGAGARYRRCRLSLRHVLQHFAGAHPLRCVLFPDSVKPRFIAVNSGHGALLSFGQVCKPLFCWNHCGTAGERDCSELQRCARPHNFIRSSRVLPRLDCRSATLAGTDKDASRSLNREGANRAWVFEVKYFKYTLFAAFLLPHRRAAVAGRVRNVGTAALGCPSSAARPPLHRPHFPLANPLSAG
jgi:hypothetical protein